MRKAESAKVWIIGIGNPHRRDDGVGSHVVARLGCSLGLRKKCRLLSLLHLNLDLVEDLGDARCIVLVDAAVRHVEGGWRWTQVLPEWGVLPYLTHHLSAPLFLGFVQAMHHRCPPTWLVTVQGKDFGLGEGLCPETEKRAGAAILDIAYRVWHGGLTRRDIIENDISRGASNEQGRRHTRGG